MKLRLFILAAFIFCFAFSAAVIPAAAKNVHDPAVEDDIREAVLRYQMASWGRNAKEMKEANYQNDKWVAGGVKFKQVFISVNGEDPSDAFMSRFDNFPSKVKKRSQAGIDKKAIYTIVDETSGEQGIIFSVGPIEWLRSNLVKTVGSYACGGLCGGGTTFTVQRKHRRWTVTGSGVHWAS